MKRYVKWFCMLSKRLYKKPSFVALLLLIPLCVALFSSAAQQSSGLVHIVLAQEQADDPVATQVINKLVDEPGVVEFTRTATVQEALELVQAGHADEAWIFPADTGNATDLYVAGKQESVVSIVTRENDLSLLLARQIITTALYETTAKSYYVHYIQENIPQLDALSQEELLAYFDNVPVDADLFVDGNPANAQNLPQTNYLTSPVRGMLAVLMLLGCAAATLYYMQDEAAGTFSLIPESKRGLTALCCVLTAVLHIGVLVLLSLCFSSLAGNIARETGALVLYGLCCGAFCLLLKQIFVNVPAFAATFPLLAVVTISLCPVIVDLRDWSVVQHLLPPTYYVNATYDSKYLLYMPAYFVACIALTALLSHLRRLIQRR